MRAAYRCPRPDCGETFASVGAVPGALTTCPACGRSMNARPLEMEAELARRERETEGGRGIPLERLPVAVLVDNVRSLWNVGSIFRTADACGLAEVVLAGISGAPPREAIAKTALGGDRYVPWRYRASALTALESMRDEGFTPVALENTADAVSLTDLRDWPGKTLLVVGNEVRGVSPEVLDACTVRTTIPMRGVKRTLNVAVAFGIAAFAATR